jgi:hypothetical protein
MSRSLLSKGVEAGGVTTPSLLPPYFLAESWIFIERRRNCYSPPGYFLHVLGILMGRIVLMFIRCTNRSELEYPALQLGLQLAGDELQLLHAGLLAQPAPHRRPRLPHLASSWRPRSEERNDDIVSSAFLCRMIF